MIASPIRTAQRSGVRSGTADSDMHIIRHVARSNWKEGESFWTNARRAQR
jgi:hypothetical protein